MIDEFINLLNNGKIILSSNNNDLIEELEKYSNKEQKKNKDRKDYILKLKGEI